MRIRTIKYLDARTLAHNVRYHYEQGMVSILDYKLVVGNHEASVMELKSWQLDFYRGMKVAMLDWGWIIETAQETALKDIIKETLISHDGREAVITARRIVSANSGTKLCKCLRDDEYPVGSIVRLTRAKFPRMSLRQVGVPF